MLNLQVNIFFQFRLFFGSLRTGPEGGVFSSVLSTVVKLEATPMVRLRSGKRMGTCSVGVGEDFDHERVKWTGCSQLLFFVLGGMVPLMKSIH